MLSVPERSPDTGSTLPLSVAAERWRTSCIAAWAHAIRLLIENRRLRGEIALLQAELDRRSA